MNVQRMTYPLRSSSPHNSSPGKVRDNDTIPKADTARWAVERPQGSTSFCWTGGGGQTSSAYPFMVLLPRLTISVMQVFHCRQFVLTVCHGLKPEARKSPASRGRKRKGRKAHPEEAEKVVREEFVFAIFVSASFGVCLRCLSSRTGPSRSIYLSTIIPDTDLESKPS